MKYTIKDIAHLISGEVEGDETLIIDKLSTLESASSGSISFLSNPKYENKVYTTQATAVIVKKEFQPSKPVKSVMIRVSDPYVSFSMLLDEYNRMISYQKEGIEDPSFIGEKSTVGQKIYRGAFSYIGKNVKIGDNVKIYPHVCIGDDSRIGDNTILYSGVKIYDKTIIGNNCQIHAGAVIGSDGFGYAPQQDGSYKKIPQLGNVVLEDNVDIGANTVIDCATLESTVLRKGVKLDNLIQIAHNVIVGENSAIAAQAGISGSTTIGKNCIIAGQAGIVGHIEIADKVTIGAQSGVTKSIKKEGETILGSPAFEIRECRRSYAIFKRLPELQAGIHQLEKKLRNLEED